jgi:hypothetical protein
LHAGFRNGPEGVNPLISRLAAGLMLPFVVGTAAATSCH